MNSRMRSSAALVAALVALAIPSSASAFEPLLTIGAPGIGAGEIGIAQGLDVDGLGVLSVADAGLDRVTQFDQQGNFLRSFGEDVIPGVPTGFEVCSVATTCQPGTASGAAGALIAPADLAAVPAGDGLHVSEIASNRVSSFNGTTSFTRAFGQDVIPGGSIGFEKCTTATTCKPGALGFAAASLPNPAGIAVNANGEILVADPLGRVQKYTADGNYLNGSGFPGPAAGQAGLQSGLTTSSNGEIIGADQTNSRINVYGPEGGFRFSFGFDVVPGPPAQLEVCTIATECKIGTPAPEGGGLNSPRGVAVSPEGHIYVVENTAHRVSEFTAAGGFVRAFGYDVVIGGPTGFEICAVAASCKLGVGGTSPGQLAAPWGVAVDCRGTVYVSQTSNARINKYGEPGVRGAPCPSNAFTIGTAKLNKKKGTAKLPVTVPGPGTLTLAGKGVKAATLAPTVAGALDVAIKPDSKAKKQLKKKGKAKTNPSLTFLPPNGDPNTQVTKVKLRKKLKK